MKITGQFGYGTANAAKSINIWQRSMLLVIVNFFLNIRNVYYFYLSNRQVAKTKQTTQPATKKKCDYRIKLRNSTKLLVSSSRKSAHLATAILKSRYSKPATKKIKHRSRVENRVAGDFMQPVSDEKKSKAPSEKVKIVLDDGNGTEVAMKRSSGEVWQNITSKEKKVLKEKFKSLFNGTQACGVEKTFQLTTGSRACINFHKTQSEYVISDLRIKRETCSGSISPAGAPQRPAKRFRLVQSRDEIFGMLSQEKKTNKAYVAKLCIILDNIETNPYHNDSGFGQHTEKLKKDLKGLWSRRANKDDRVVYEMDEKNNTIKIVQVEGHYE
ncbi:MAG: type II toxin-antitoxin system YoeB family toxin [Puniceicoccales bacterium]|nr:type II toxin-antitoxin system YoeB family toxin [Puniceicoccales bacterium]